MPELRDVPARVHSLACIIDRGLCIADVLVGLREPWNYRVAITAAWAIGDDRVLVHTHVRAEGGTSGAAVHISTASMAAGGEFTMPPTKVTGSTIAILNDTCGNLIQIAQLDRSTG